MRRTYAGEMAWAMNMAYTRNYDRNPNRVAQVTVALLYGLAVDIARRSHEPLPERPDIDEAI